MFVVASNSELLYKMYQDTITGPEDKPLIILENVLPDVFDRILRFMYTGTCDVAELGPCMLKIRREDVKTVMKKEKDDIDIEMEIGRLYYHYYALFCKISCYWQTELRSHTSKENISDTTELT